MENFYLICPIGTEEVLKSEIELKYRLHFSESDFEMELTPGGIELKVGLAQGLLLNKILKTPSRILLRLKGQKCRDLPKLFNIIKKYEWRNIVEQDLFNIEVAAKKSRLIHTDRIKETVESGLADYFTINPLKKKVKERTDKNPRPTLFIRLFEDELTISIDTSGELLHVRGDREYRGHASLRENFAAILLLKLLGTKSYTDVNLIDPMCGTGTFLFEAKSFMDLNTRIHAYEFFTKSFLNELPKISDQDSIWNFKKYIGSDIDDDIILKNLEHNSSIKFTIQDVFLSHNAGITEKSIIITNPPYGKRIKIEGDKVAFYQDLIKAVKANYSPLKLGLIIPYPAAKEITARKFNFNQNGIQVGFLIL